MAIPSKAKGQESKTLVSSFAPDRLVTLSSGACPARAFSLLYSTPTTSRLVLAPGLVVRKGGGGVVLEMVGVRPQLYGNEVLASPSEPTSPGSRLGSFPLFWPPPVSHNSAGVGGNFPNSGVSSGH